MTTLVLSILSLYIQNVRLCSVPLALVNHKLAKSLWTGASGHLGSRSLALSSVSIPRLGKAFDVTRHSVIARKGSLACVWSSNPSAATEECSGPGSAPDLETDSAQSGPCLPPPLGRLPCFRVHVFSFIVFKRVCPGFQPFRLHARGGGVLLQRQRGVCLGQLPCCATRWTH